MLLIGFSENTLSRESAGMTTATNERRRMALLAQSFTAVASNEFLSLSLGSRSSYVTIKR